jgi:hypothetical protein
MITVIVKYQPANPISRNDFKAMMQFGAQQQFSGLPHLLSKQFCFDETSGQGLSVYLWESKAHAEAFFNDEFMATFQQAMGCSPLVEYHEALVVVDNRQGDVLVS